jgi:hypothetical protein
MFMGMSDGADDGMDDLSHRTGPSPGADQPPAPERRRDRPLTPAAQRALAEAEARRAEIDRKAEARPKEFSGRKGPDPARYGDWEVKGIVSDF